MDDSTKDIPLASIQEHFWSAGEVSAADGSLRECVALRVHGPLERRFLQHAVHALLTRHEILRSTVTSDEDGARMRIHPPSPEPDLSWLDLSPLPPAEREEAAHRHVRELAGADIDMAAGPLVRFLALRLDRDDHVVALGVHHIVADATAVRLILSEVSEDYRAAARGAPSAVPEPELQYGDFALWERNTLLPAAEESDGGFWRETLRDAPARLDLRPDRPRPPVKGTRGHRTTYRFDASVGAGLREFARRNRTTPYTAALAAFSALIARSTGENDFVLGVLSANRPVPEVENLIGQFANTIPLRVTMTADADFAALTAHCGRVVADALDHDRLAWSRILEHARPERDPSRTPLVQHLFLPAVNPLEDLAFCGLPTLPVEVQRDRGRFDTVIELEVSERGARVWIEYDTALYTEDGITALLRDYERVLRHWLAEPDTPLSRLPLGEAPNGGPAADLRAALDLDAADTVLVHETLAEAPAVRAAAETAGARVRSAGADGEPVPRASVALIPADLLGAYSEEGAARIILVTEPVTAADLDRGSSRRVLRLLRTAADTLLVVDITGLPDTWPRVVHVSGGHPVVDTGTPQLSPHTPGTLHVSSSPTSLTARWSPTGDLEIVDGARFTAPDPGAASLAEDDPLLGLVRELWAEALRLPTVAPDDDFFASGGYSIVATRLVTELSDTLRVDVRVRTLFENPTPARLTTALRSRHPHLDAFLELVAAAPREDPPVPEAAPEPVAPAREERTIPLLAAQRQLWLAEQANPGALTHTIPLLLHITGPLDGEALRGAVGDVVARQDGLRGVFEEVDGEPVQRVLPFLGIEVEYTDLSPLPPSERAAREQRLKRETAYGGFDITTGPLLRARLVRTGEERHVLHLLFHHLVTDEVSMTVFMRELSEFYRARVTREPPRLPRLDVGFADLVTAEREALAGPEGERLRRYWARELADAPVLALPTDHPRPEQPSFVGEFLERPGPRELAEAMGQLARAHSTTVFTVFCAATTALLHHLSSYTDIVLGAPSENRGTRGAEHLVGCFLNVLPVRVNCSGDPTFTELLERVGESLFRAYEHQRLPFAEIVDAVRPERTPGQHPIYQVTCELQLPDWMPIDLPGCATSYELVSHGTARYDLSFHALMHREGISAMLEVNTSLWERDTGLARLDQLLGILSRVTTNPKSRLSELPV